MTKCDFCTQSSPNGECNWNSQSVREEYCKKAIKEMTKAIKNKSK